MMGKASVYKQSTVVIITNFGHSRILETGDVHCDEITSEISEIPAICNLWSYVCHLMPLSKLYCGILK